MQENYFYHALKIDKKQCIGCTHCISVCPTQAIRIINGKAEIIQNRCVDCGECYKACPVSAIKVEDNDLNIINKFKYKVALIPAILRSQFPDNINESKIFDSLIQIGFTHVYEVELSADLISKKVKEELKSKNCVKPLISSFCPAIVRLIQVKFPSLIDNIIKIKPPIDITALYIKKHLSENGVDPKDIGIFYITPCAAKIAAIYSPVGEIKSVVNGTFNLNNIYNKIFKNLIKNNEKDNNSQKINLTKTQLTWCLTNGEAKNYSCKSLSIDGIQNVIEYLEKIETQKIKDVDFLELRACDESCAGGILNVQNRFLSVEKMMKLSKENTNTNFVSKITDYKEFLEKKILIEDIKPRSMIKLDEDLDQAINKMEKIQKIMNFLPKIDCGACGAPTCLALAEDIAQNKADISQCIFLKKNINTDKTVEKIWGKNRFKNIEDYES